jgi:hypothetical protein
MTEIKQMLEQFNRGARLDSSILERLDGQGYIKISDVTNFQTPPGQREYLFIDFTEKGRKVLQE